MDLPTPREVVKFVALVPHYFGEEDVDRAQVFAKMDSVASNMRDLIDKLRNGVDGGDDLVLLKEKIVSAVKDSRNLLGIGLDPYYGRNLQPDGSFVVPRLGEVEHPIVYAAWAMHLPPYQRENLMSFADVLSYEPDPSVNSPNNIKRTRTYLEGRLNNVISLTELRRQYDQPLKQVGPFMVRGLTADEQMVPAMQVINEVLARLGSVKCEYLAYGQLTFVPDNEEDAAHEIEGVAGTFNESTNSISVAFNVNKMDDNFVLLKCGSLLHELGHRLWYKHLTTDERDDFIKSATSSSGRILSPSKYGTTKIEESFAEHFAFHSGIRGGKYNRTEIIPRDQFLEICGVKP